LPVLRLNVAGVDVDAHLDTGSAGRISLPKRYADKLPLASKPVEVGRARRIDREVIITGAKLNGAIKFGRYTLENPEVRFNDAPIGNIGFEILRRFVVTLDKKNHRFRLAEPVKSEKTE